MKKLALSIAILFVIFFFIRKILTPVVLSAMIAYVMLPIQQRLEKVIGRRVAAAIITTSFLLFFALTSIFFAVKIYNFIVKVWEESQKNATFFGNISKYEEEIAKIVIDSLKSISVAIPKTIADLTIFFFLLYYFLADRHEIMRYFRDILPEFEFFVENTRKILNAILYGHFLTAVVQSILCFIFFTIFNAPYVFLFSVLSFFLSVIGITPAVIYVPLGIYKIISHSVLEGVGIIASGIFVVSTIDNIIKPKIAEKFYDIHPAIFLISMVGGIYVLGFSGMFIGPIVFGLLKAVVLYVKTESKKD